MAEPITNVLGTVAIKHCGEYDATMHYEKLNVVTYNGSSYCAKDNTVGNLPTNTTYWDLMAEKGDTGETGDTPVKGVDYYTAADKAELEANLAVDVTSEVSEQLESLTSATPLVAASTAAMTDTSRIYVNSADGHWYWYNGEDWTDGGDYLATPIENNSIEGAKLANDTISPYSIINLPYQETKNVFKYCKWIKGYRYFNGELYAAPGYISTLGKVKVTPGTTYTIKRALVSPERISQYNSEGAYIGDTTPSTTWTSGSAVHYLALTLTEEGFDSEILTANKGSDYITIPWATVNNESIEGVKIADKTISPFSLNGVQYQETENVFGFCKWIRGYRYYQGNLVKEPGYISTLDKIPVTPGATYTTEYTMSGLERVVKYNSDGTFSTEGAMPASWAPSGAYYLAMTMKEENFDPNIIKSSKGSKYITIPWLNNDSTINKKIVVYGDSLWGNCEGNYNYPSTPYNQSTGPCYGYKQHLQNLGLTIDNYAISGGTSQGTAEHSGINYPTNITSAHAQEYDAMIISFGRNDARLGLPIGILADTGTNTFIGAIKYIIETMLTKNPRLKIFLWSLTQSSASGFGPDSINSAGFKEIDYANALYEIADKYSCTVVDMYRESGINMQNIETFTFEGVHLTNDGYEFTAPYYKNKMLNNLKD